MMRWIAIIGLSVLAGSADAQLLLGVSQSNSGGGNPVPPSCTADGGTDWSNACDIPLMAAIMGF
jgi:hypothetical protein